MLNKMLIEATKDALWIFVELICEFTAIYCGAFIGSLIIKKDINWMEQMVMAQYISLAFLGLTTFFVVYRLIVFIYKTKANKNTMDKKILYLEMFMSDFEYFMLGIYLICVATLLKSFSSISMDLFFISSFSLVIVSLVIHVFHLKNVARNKALV